MPIVLRRSPDGQDPQKPTSATMQAPAQPAAPAIQPPAAAEPPASQDLPQDPQPQPSVYARLIEQRLQQAPTASQPGPSVYSRLIEQRMRAEDQLVQASFDAALQSDPNLAGEAQQVAAEIGTSPETALRNPQVAKEIAARRQTAARDLAAFSPILHRQLADKDFAAIARDDLDNLGTFERMFAQWDVGKLEFEQGVLGDKVRSGAASADEVKRLIDVRTRLRYMPRASGFLEGAAKVLGQQAASLPRALSVGAAASTVAMGVAAIGGQMGPQVALSEELATVPAAAVIGFTMGTLGELALQSYRTESGNAYLDMIEQGYTRDAASKASFGVGVANAVLEMVGVKALAKGAGITAKTLRETLGREVADGVATALARPTMGQALRQFAKGYGTGLGGEVFTEVAQEATNIAAEELARRLSDNPDALSSTVTRGEIVQRLVETAVQTTQGMALLAAPGPTLQLFRDQRRAAAAEHTAQFWKELGAARDASKVIPRNVGKAEQFLAEAAKDTQAAETFVDGHEFAKVLNQADWDAADQGTPKPSEQLEKALPGILERIALAEARGEDVVIPTAEVGTKLAGTPLYQKLVPHLRLDADAMSLADAQVFRQQEEQRTAEAEKVLAESEAGDRTFAESARGVEESIRAQLVAAGRDYNTARTEAKFYRDLVIVKAKQLGMLPAEFHAKYELKVRAGEMGRDGRVMQQSGPLDSPGQPGQSVPTDGGQRPTPPEAGSGDARGASAGMASGPATSEGQAAQPGDGQRAAPIPRVVARYREDVAGEFAARTVVAETAVRELGTDVVNTAADAAQALSSIGRSAAERFDALVTDKDGRPLAIVGSFKGDVAQVRPHLATLVAEAFRIEGAANIWFAHNHPSGNPQLSKTDRLFNQALTEAFRGSQITPRGLLAIGGAPGEWNWRAFGSANEADVLGRIEVTRQPANRVQVPVVERMLGVDDRLGSTLTAKNVLAASKQIANGRAGILLVDPDGGPLAFVPIEDSMAAELRRDGRIDSLYRAVSVANAAGGVIVNNGSLSDASVLNLAGMLNSLRLDNEPLGEQIAVLDVVDTQKNTTWLKDGRIDFAEATGFRSGNNGFYRPRDFTVFLTKKQNASTFLHELAHHYLEILADLAQQKAHPEIVDDYRALVKWFGLPEGTTWSQLSFEQQAKHHEQFARSFELWLWEGKAPSQAFEGVFARVARWMREVYGTIVGEINAQYRAQMQKEFPDRQPEDLPALTPEVRQVMGRMIASQQEIDHAADVSRMADTFESQQQAGVDDAAWAEHEALVGEANEQAVADHTRERLREIQWFSRGYAERIRDLQKQHDATRARVRDEVEAELQGQPVFRARHWLETGEVLGADGAKAMLSAAEDPWAHTEGFEGGGDQAAPSHKLQTEAALALLPDGTDAKALAGRGGILAPDGVLPDVAARVFGFETGEALVQALLQTPTLAAAIDARTDARMLEEYSDLADPKRRELAVLRALHNDKRTRLIAWDLRAVGKMLGPVRLLMKGAREQAKRILSRTPVSQISAREHMQAEAKAAKAFSAALKAGDMPAAAAAQQRRLLQHELAKEASAILDEIDEGLQDLGRFVGSDEKLATTRDIDLVYSGREVAAKFGIGPKLASDQERQLVTKALEKLRAERPVLASRVDALIALAGEGASWREMRLESFRELVETGQALWTEAGKARWLEHENRRQLLATVVQDGVAQIEALPARAKSAAVQTGKTPTMRQRWVLKGWNVVANLKRFAHWAWFMDGGKQGWFSDNFVRPLGAALGRYWGKRAEVIAKLHPQLMAVRAAAGPLWDAEIAVPEADLKGQPLVLRGKKELLGMLLHAGSLSNLIKLLVPYGFAWDPNVTNGELQTQKWDTFLARMFDKGVLTQQDVEFVRFVWDVYKELLPEDQKTHKALYGFEFRTIELRELATPFGTLSGGYVPAFVDQDKLQSPRPSSTLETLEGEQQNFQYSISTGRGHTLSRNPNYMKPLALDVALQVQHIDKQLRFTYLQPAIAQILKLLRNRDFSEALATYDREAINSIILPMLENAALQAGSRPSGLPFVDAVANWLRAGVSLAQLGFNLVNSLLQLTGFSNSAGAVRGRFMRSAVLSVGGDPREAVRVAMQKSAFMQERLDQRTKVLRDDINRVARSGSDFARNVKWVQQMLSRAAFWPQRMLQGIVDIVTWHAAYQQHVAESSVGGLRDEAQIDADAVAFADSVVKRTQGSSNPEDLAAYESGTPAMKLLTQFGSYSNVVLNQVLSAQPGWSPKMRAMVWAVLVPAFAEASMRALLQGVPDDDKDGEKDLEEIALLYTKSLVRNATGLVPVAGPMLLAAAESEGQRVLASPASTLLQQAIQGGYAAAGAATGDDVTAAEVRAIGTLMTLVTGLPIVPITRAISYDINVGLGRVPQPTGPVDYLRGMVVGR